MENKKIERYAELKSQLKELKNEEKTLSAEIAGEMLEAKVEKMDTDYGKFYFTNKKAWKYTLAVTDLEVEALKASDLVKAQQKSEQLSGEATSTESKTLTFRA